MADINFRREFQRVARGQFGIGRFVHDARLAAGPLDRVLERENSGPERRENRADTSRDRRDAGQSKRVEVDPAQRPQTDPNRERIFARGREIEARDTARDEAIRKNGGFGNSPGGQTAFENFRYKLAQNPDAEKLMDKLAADPALTVELASSWQREVVEKYGEDPTDRRSYTGRGETILDRINEAAKDPARRVELLGAKNTADFLYAARKIEPIKAPASNTTAEPAAPASTSADASTLPPKDEAAIERLGRLKAKINGSADNAALVSGVESQMSRNPAALKLYQEGGFSRDKAGLIQFTNFAIEVEQNPGAAALKKTFEQNPKLGREVLDEWRQKVGDISKSAGYQGGADTILDRINTAAQDPAKLAQMKSAKTLADLNRIIKAPAQQASIDSQSVGPKPAAASVGGGAVANANPMEKPVPGGKVMLDPANPTQPVFTPDTQTASAANAPKVTKYDPPKLASGASLTTKELNELSRAGIVPSQTPIGQDKTRVFTYADGSIYGGFTQKSDGQVDKFVSRSSLEEKYGSEKLAGMEKMLQNGAGKPGPDTQVAASNVAPAADKTSAPPAPVVKPPLSPGMVNQA